MDSNGVEFGDRLKEIRKARGITQTQLAHKSGLTSSAISQFENGIRKPSFKSLGRISRAVGIPASTFISGGIEPSLRAAINAMRERVANETYAEDDKGWFIALSTGVGNIAQQLEYDKGLEEEIIRVIAIAELWIEQRREGGEADI